MWDCSYIISSINSDMGFTRLEVTFKKPSPCLKPLNFFLGHDRYLNSSKPYLTIIIVSTTKAKIVRTYVEWIIKLHSQQISQQFHHTSQFTCQNWKEKKKKNWRLWWTDVQFDRQIVFCYKIVVILTLLTNEFQMCSKYYILLKYTYPNLRF